MEDFSNRYFVAARNNGAVLAMLNPPDEMSPEDAIILAAWLVAMAEPHSRVTFAEALEKVERT